MSFNTRASIIPDRPLPSYESVRDQVLTLVNTMCDAHGIERPAPGNPMPTRVVEIIFQSYELERIRLGTGDKLAHHELMIEQSHLDFLADCHTELCALREARYQTVEYLQLAVTRMTWLLEALLMAIIASKRGWTDISSLLNKW